MRPVRLGAAAKMARVSSSVLSCRPNSKSASYGQSNAAKSCGHANDGTDTLLAAHMQVLSWEDVMHLCWQWDVLRSGGTQVYA